MSLASPMPSAADLGRLFVRHPARWLLPAVVCGAIALAYALLKDDEWMAAMGLIVRNEAAGNVDGPGKFRHSDELKHLQETLLEIVKNRDVLTHTLLAVGPPADRKATAKYPTDKEVEEFMDNVSLAPPSGGEFGKTEVIYLCIQDKSRERALRLTDTLWEQARQRFAEIREQKAESMIRELGRTVSMNEHDVQAAMTRVAEIEKQVGGDLAELRSLNQFSSGNGDLRQKTLALENELRAAKVAQQNAQELFDLLMAAQDDPTRLVATPNRLLESQPALRRLKEGLVDAQLVTSKHLGTMTDTHPRVLAAVASEEQIREHLHAELGVAIRGVQVELRLTSDQIARLNAELAGVRERLDRLASLRAEYSRLTDEATHRTALLQASQKQLADVRATEASALVSSLIVPIDRPTTGSRPLGPGKRVIVLGGGMGGLLIGIGVVLLMAPSGMPPSDRRPADEMNEEPTAAQEEPLAMPTRRFSVRAAMRRRAN